MRTKQWGWASSFAARRGTDHALGNKCNSSVQSTALDSWWFLVVPGEPGKLKDTEKETILSLT